MRMASIGRPPYHKFTHEDMEEAANNFDPSNLVEEGQVCVHITLCHSVLVLNSSMMFCVNYGKKC